MRQTIVPILAFLFALPFQLFAQQPSTIKLPSHQKEEFCAQSIVLEKALYQNKGLNLRHQSIEQALYQYLSNHSGKPKNLPPMYVLPVVVHIIHNNGAENISDATVLQGIQDLNDAYANIGYYDPATGVDTKVQFCLAKRDPDGNATTGITRNESILTDMVLETDDITVKDLNRWDPTQYINIWLVKEICSNSVGCGVAGYAYFPSSHGMPEDGIMMEAEYFGSSQGASGVQIHEMGHYLGLYHTFQGGCTNADCLGDGDRVCDTPPDQSTAAVPCGSTANSCSTDTQSGFATDQNDLIEDYMDYGDFDCWSVFTQGQTERMHWHIENVRPSLLQSQACLDPCTSALEANFIPSLGTLDVGGTVNFANTSVNSTSYEWTVDGVQFSTAASPSYTFNTDGSFEVCLKVGNTDPNCSDRFCTTITVTCPVAASFTAGNLYPAPGQSVAFSNTSANATGFAWTVNNIAAGSSTNLTYQFSNPGINKICLTANNGLCTNTFCQNVFVIEITGGGDCIGNYIKTLGNIGTTETAGAIITTPDGDILIGGSHGDASLLTLVSPDGEIVWSRTFNMTNGNDFVFAMMFDSDGKLLLVGRDQTNSSTVNYLFKYDLQTDQVLWSKLMPNPDYTRLEILLEKQPNDNYLVMGMAGTNSIFMELDRNTGAVLNMKLFDFGTTDHFLGASIFNNEIYAVGVQRNGGLDKIRASITKLDMAGNQLWTRLYFNSLNEIGRTYLYESIIENNEIVAYGRGDLTGDSFTDGEILLLKANLSGEFVMARKYNIPSSNTEFSGSMLSLPDGYILQGNHVLNASNESENFVMRVDKQGNLIWAKSVKHVDNSWGNYLTLHNGELYLTGSSNLLDPSNDALLLKMTLDGEVLGAGCDLVYDLNITASNVVNDYDGLHPLTPLADTYTMTNSAPQPIVANLDDNYMPGCECQSFSPACDTSFLRTYGTPLGDERSQALVEIPAALGGGFLLGGSKLDSAMLTRLDISGNIVWTRAFDATSQGPTDVPDIIIDLMFDSDNNVVGCGHTYDEPDGNVEGFLFKYNMTTNDILWVNELNLPDPALEFYTSISEKSPGGNYIISGTINTALGTSTTGENATILEVNRNNGVNVWQFNYNLGSSEDFKKVLLHNGSIYTTGRYNFDNGGTARMRPGITKMSLTGVQQWSKLYLRAVTNTTTARLYSTDMLADNGLVVLGQGDNSGTSTTNVTPFLFKTDNDGNLLWAMNYDIPGANTEVTTKLLNLPDGYLCLGYYTASNQDVFLFKTDKQGQLVWSKSYGNTANEDAFDMVYANGQIYFTGKTKAAAPGSTFDLYFANIGVDGNANALDSCNLFTDLTMTATPYVNAYNAQHNLTDLNLSWSEFLDDYTVSETAVQSTTVCFQPCLDTCEVVPNAFFQMASATCLGDSLLVSLTACNLGAFDLPAGTPVSFYLGNPTTTNATLIGVFALPQNLAQTECGTFEFTIAASPNTLIFAVLNDDGTTPRPFDLSTFMADVMECDYTNNLGSFIHDFTAPILDLGPDVFLCENGVTVLDAGAGFASYLWQDGSIEQTYTAFGPGTYSVTVTDACGGQQTDEVVVTVDASTVLDLGPDVELCSGGSYQFDVQGYDTYQWSPADYLSCTDCPNPTSTPTGNVTYTLVATAATGCISVDTISLTVGGIIESFEDIQICEGDTVQVFGMPVFEAGQFSQVFTTAAGCDSTVTVSVGILPVVESFEDIQICQGDTAFVFGMPITAAGQFSQVYTSAAGCDSTVTISVGLLFPVATQESISICAGETADVFGSQIGAAGTYSQTYNGFNGCDSTHTIVLTVNAVSLEIATVNVSCTALGSATATASGSTAPYAYQWSNMESTASIGSLAAGTYTVTATDANGCTNTVTATITGAQGPGVSINIVTQLSENNPDGGVLNAAVTGGTGPFTFDWNNDESTAQIDSLSSGSYVVTVTDANGCTATASAALFVPACTGGKIWNDTDRDGCQDPGETGLANVVLMLSGTSTTGQSIAANTLSAINGEYIFTGLPPGTYFVKITVPTGMALSQPNACGNTTSDSDFSTSTFMSGAISLVEGHCCLIIDGGLYDACLNLTTTGEICCDQTLCGPGNDPAPITSSIPAGGGGGPTQYMWMYSTIGGPMGVNWTNIPGATSASYDPGPLSQTTHFIRCAKSSTCTTWLESNTVTITVDDEAVAAILPPGPICVNDPVSFASAPNQPGATYSWNFGAWATPGSSNQQNPTVTFTQAGVTTITLTVVRNGCISTAQLSISISDNPSYCGSAIVLPGNGGSSNFAPNTSASTQLDGAFTVFPNPFSNSLTVAWGKGIESVVSVKLFSVDGRLLHAAQSGNGEQSYVAELADLLPGVYLLRLQSSDGRTGIFKIVKE